MSHPLLSLALILTFVSTTDASDLSLETERKERKEEKRVSHFPRAVPPQPEGYQAEENNQPRAPRLQGRRLNQPYAQVDTNFEAGDNTRPVIGLGPLDREDIQRDEMPLSPIQLLENSQGFLEDLNSDSPRNAVRLPSTETVILTRPSMYSLSSKEILEWDAPSTPLATLPLSGGNENQPTLPQEP